MKEKILLAIKAKYPAVNLSKRRLDVIAAILEKKVGTDETLIDAKIDEFNDYSPLADIAKQDDKMRDLESKVKTPATTPKKDEDQGTETPITDDTPAWAKAIIESNKKLSADLTVLQTEKAQGTIKSKATELLKDVPVSFWDGWAIPDKIDDLPAFVEKVQTKHTQYEQGKIDAGIGGIPAPRVGTGATPVGAVSPELKKYVESKAKVAAQQPVK